MNKSEGRYEAVKVLGYFSFGQKVIRQVDLYVDLTLMFSTQKASSTTNLPN